MLQLICYRKSLTKTGILEITIHVANYSRLHALEPRVNGLGERLGQRGLARAGKILQQHMAARGERGEQLPRGAGLAAHDGGDVAGDFFAGLACGVEVGWCHGRFWRLKQRGCGKVS